MANDERNENRPGAAQPSPEQQMRQRADQIRGRREHRPQDAPPPEAGVGGPDASSGGGNASGAPDAETGMRAEDIVNKGDPKRDKDRIFHQPGQVRMQEEAE